MHYGRWKIRLTSSLRAMALTVPRGIAAIQGCPYATGAATPWPSRLSMLLTPAGSGRSAQDGQAPLPSDHTIAAEAEQSLQDDITHQHQLQRQPTPPQQQKVPQDIEVWAAEEVAKILSRLRDAHGQLLSQKDIQDIQRFLSAYLSSIAPQR